MGAKNDYVLTAAANGTRTTGKEARDFQFRRGMAGKSAVVVVLRCIIYKLCFLCSFLGYVSSFASGQKIENTFVGPASCARSHQSYTPPPRKRPFDFLPSIRFPSREKQRKRKKQSDNFFDARNGMNNFHQRTDGGPLSRHMFYYCSILRLIEPPWDRSREAILSGLLYFNKIPNLQRKVALISGVRY